MSVDLKSETGLRIIGRDLLVFVLAATLGFGIPFTGTLAHAADLFVNASTGADSGNCLGTPCKTITYALGQAGSGDVVNVAAGGPTTPP